MEARRGRKCQAVGRGGDDLGEKESAGSERGGPRRGRKPEMPSCSPQVPHTLLGQVYYLETSRDFTAKFISLLPSTVTIIFCFPLSACHSNRTPPIQRSRGGLTVHSIPAPPLGAETSVCQKHHKPPIWAPSSFSKLLVYLVSSFTPRFLCLNLREHLWLKCSVLREHVHPNSSHNERVLSNVPTNG